MSRPAVWLQDIVEAIELIRAEMVGQPLAAFAGDRRRQWIVERGLEIISEASRRLPGDLKARHPGIPWKNVAGIGNILRHDYRRIAYDILWHVATHDLAELELACRAELRQGG